MPSPSTLHRNDVLTGIAFLALSTILFWASLEIRDFASVGLGASFVPRLVAVLFFLIGLPLIIIGRRRVTEDVSNETSGVMDVQQQKVFGGMPAVAVTIGLMAGYLWLMQPLGFIITSTGYVFLQTLVLKKDSEKRYVLFALTSVLPTLFAYYLFVNVFGISLPVGLLG